MPVRNPVKTYIPIRHLYILACILMASAGLFTSCQTTPQNGRVSRAEAERIALKRVRSGQIKEAELEKEHGKLV